MVRFVSDIYRSSVTNGIYQAQLKTSGGASANTIQFTVLTAQLIPVTFTVNNAISTSPGDYIFLTGNTDRIRKLGNDVRYGCRTDARSELSELVFERIDSRRNDRAIQIHQNRRQWHGHMGERRESPIHSADERHGFMNVNWQY